MAGNPALADRFARATERDPRRPAIDKKLATADEEGAPTVMESADKPVAAKESAPDSTHVEDDWRPRDCVACHLANEKRQPFNKDNMRPATRVLGRIHMDLKVMESSPSLGGAKYVFVLVDEWTRYGTVLMLKSKKEAVPSFQKFKHRAEKLHGEAILEVRCDNGREFVNEALKGFLEQEGILITTSEAYTPQQNGIAERYNGVLWETIRSFKHQGNIQDDLWGELALTAAHLRNLTPMARLEWQTPWELWHRQSPNTHIRMLRTIWSECFMHLPLTRTRKTRGSLKARGAGPYRLIGYDETKSGSYRLWDAATETVKVSRDITFNEYNHTSEKASDETPDDADWDVEKIVDHRETDDDEVQYLVRWVGYDEPTWEPRSLLDDTIALDEYEDRLKILQSGETNALFHHVALHGDEDNVFHVAYSGENDYPTVTQALRGPDREAWLASRQRELDAHRINHTWDEVERRDVPPDAIILDSLYVLRIKRNPDHSINKLKTRLCINGAKQRPDSYGETYAPVIRYSTLRLMLALAARWNMEIHQMDVVTAFLYGSVADEPKRFYMRLPPDENGFRKIVLLNKALYGLKQAPRLWNQNLDDYLRSIGYKPSPFDPALYLKHDSDGRVLAMVGVYVDDLTICTLTTEAMIEFKEQMKARYSMEDMGELKYLLGIEITRDRANHTVSLCQAKYIDDICARFQQSTGRSVHTPLDANVPLRKCETSAAVDATEYQAITGSLMYLMLGTRPDLAYAVSALCRYNASPQTLHRSQALRCLRYAMTTRNLCLVLGGTDDPLVGYSDAAFNDCRDTGRSTGGYLFFVCGGLIVWVARRMALVTLSSCEAEYVELAEAAKECIWLRNLLNTIDPALVGEATIVKEDNEAAMKLANNPVFHRRTKHISLRYHFIRDQVAAGTIALEYCPTQEMTADALTKTLPLPRFQYLRRKMGLLEPSRL